MKYVDDPSFEYQPPGISHVSNEVVLYYAEDYGCKGNTFWQLNRPGDEYGVPQWTNKESMISDLQEIIEHLSNPENPSNKGTKEQ